MKISTIGQWVIGTVIAVCVGTPFCFSQELVKKDAMTLDLAKSIADSCQKKAKELGYSVAIAVRDEGGNIRIVYRMNDVGSIALKWAEAKSLTAYENKQSTATGEFRIWNIGDQTMVLGVSGGVPLLIDSQIVGAVGVSGAKGKADDLIAEAGVTVFNDTLKASQAQASPAVPQQQQPSQPAASPPAK